MALQLHLKSSTVEHNEREEITHQEVVALLEDVIARKNEQIKSLKQ